MKDFTFDFKDFYKVRFVNDVLFITELDSDGRPTDTVEITMSDLIEMHIEAQRLKMHFNPSCNAVSSARTRLENARDRRSAGGEGEDAVDLALESYTDVLIRHREASLCRVHH